MDYDRGQKRTIDRKYERVYRDRQKEKKTEAQRMLLSVTNKTEQHRRVREYEKMITKSDITIKPQ